MEPMSLTTAQDFEIERMNRAIDATNDISELRKVTKQLLMSWMMQKSATMWAMKQALPRQADRYE